MKAILFLLISIAVMSVLCSTNVTKFRGKRALIFPPGASRIQLVIGFGTPISLDNYAVVVGWVVKLRMLVPNNATQLTQPGVAFERRSFSHIASRYQIYKTFEEATKSFEFGGKSCLLRSICDVAKVPLRLSGLVGEFVHLFFTPSSTREEMGARQVMDYHSAEIQGQEADTNCRQLYPDCLVSPIELLTFLH